MSSTRLNPTYGLGWIRLDLCDGLGWVEFFFTHHSELTHMGWVGLMKWVGLNFF